MAIDYFITTVPEILHVNSESPLTARAVSAMCLLASALTAFLGPRQYSPIGVVLTTTKIVAVLLVTLAFIFRTPAPFQPTAFNVPLEIADAFTGPNSRSFATNLYHRLPDVGSFLNLFSVVFAPFAGLLCGANFTGDVRSPQKGIPRGMFYAALSGGLLFTLFSLVVSASVWHLDRLGGACRGYCGRFLLSKQPPNSPIR